MHSNNTYDFQCTFTIAEYDGLWGSEQTKEVLGNDIEYNGRLFGATFADDSHNKLRFE